MMRRPPLVAFAFALGAALVVDARTARSDPPAALRPVVPVVRGSPLGVPYLQHAARMFTPKTGTLGALVQMPRDRRAEDFGLEAVAPGIARLHGSPAHIEAFGLSHPELRIEVSSPIHPTLDIAGKWVRSFIAHQQGVDGKGVIVGVADTGLDVVNPEMQLPTGSRVLWMLDLSLEPLGAFPDLEKKYGVTDDTGKIVAGAVLSTSMINDILTSIRRKNCVETAQKKCAPSDEVGHGTHVTGIAAGTGADPGRYPGIAPSADIIAVRIARQGDVIQNDDLVRAVQFMFDRADFEKKPMVANLSLGSDFGPHDGTMLWEQSIASYVGPDKPGHAVVAAAGNSGSILETPIHQSVRVSRGSKMRVPIRTLGADSGGVQVWVTLRAGADLKIGLDGPDGEWIAPVDQGHQSGKNTDDYNAGVIYGSDLDQSPIPQDSHSAVVVWNGKWPTGQYSITLEGSGMAELFLEGLGDAQLGSEREATFANGVREGTINLPATHPSIIAVGCTVNRPRWTSIAGAEVGLKVPILDDAGGLPGPRRDAAGNLIPTFRDLDEGEMCWFSSAGPTATGVPKPEIAAPGALVISAMSRTALPGTPGSVFNNPSCPPTKTGKNDDRCLQIDNTHAIAVGTSMSSPVVAGVIALLLQRDPTLTQDKIIALLQAGAHQFRGAAPFFDQTGPGEVDAVGALDALEQMKATPPQLLLPSSDRSWLTLSADYVAADGSTPLTSIIELRTSDGAHRADFFDQARLVPVVSVDGVRVDPPPALLRRGPGLFTFAWTPDAGLGGSRATFGAEFDGTPIVAEHTIPIATDGWSSSYPSHAGGSSCSVQASSERTPAWIVLGALGFTLLRRSRRSTNGVPTPRRPDRSGRSDRRR
jgi:subtilisin family serine protease